MIFNRESFSDITLSDLIYKYNKYKFIACTNKSKCNYSDQCFNIGNCFSFKVKNCFNVAYCTNINFCAFCWGLKNKKYHILNNPYSKKEYTKILKKLNM